MNDDSEHEICGVFGGFFARVDKVHDQLIEKVQLGIPFIALGSGVGGTRWLDDGVVGRGSCGEGLLGEAMKEQPAGL